MLRFYTISQNVGSRTPITAIGYNYETGRIYVESIGSAGLEVHSFEVNDNYRQFRHLLAAPTEDNYQEMRKSALGIDRREPPVSKLMAQEAEPYPPQVSDAVTLQLQLDIAVANLKRLQEGKRILKVERIDPEIERYVPPLQGD